MLLSIPFPGNAITDVIDEEGRMDQRQREQFDEA